jgi:hypothetical protein
VREGAILPGIPPSSRLVSAKKPLAAYRREQFPLAVLIEPLRAINPVEQLINAAANSGGVDFSGMYVGGGASILKHITSLVSFPGDGPKLREEGSSRQGN